MPLTDIAVRQAKARDRAYKLADGSGLCLLVQPNGSKWWRYRYRFWGRENMLSVGVYPGTSLSQARALAGEARKLLDQGKDPGAERVIARKTQDTSFEAVARHLLAAMEKHVHAHKRAPAATERRSTSCCGETGEPCVAARTAMMSSMSATTTSAPMSRS